MLKSRVEKKMIFCKTLEFENYMKISLTDLLYGGSFSRFMQVAEVGNRSRSASMTFDEAVLRLK